MALVIAFWLWFGIGSDANERLGWVNRLLHFLVPAGLFMVSTLAALRWAGIGGSAADVGRSAGHRLRRAQLRRRQVQSLYHVLDTPLTGPTASGCKCPVPGLFAKGAAGERMNSLG